MRYPLNWRQFDGRPWVSLLQRPSQRPNLAEPFLELEFNLSRGLGPRLGDSLVASLNSETTITSVSACRERATKSTNENWSERPILAPQVGSDWPSTRF
ncbi:MAG: hypothetical protein CMP98_11785 [Gammaproteobacteria bacterium]|nr:hypothetical protein [Gammaproteobacteria bacterium]OUU07848.1 MAG: hypothetical protein CBB94_12145 [Gammaproteobacteria bacterium TMED34]